MDGYVWWFVIGFGLLAWGGSALGLLLIGIGAVAWLARLVFHARR